VIARDVFDAAATWAAIDDLDLAVSAATQDEMFLRIRRLVERSARWIVRHSDSLAIGPTVVSYRPGVRSVNEALPDLLVGSAHAEAAAMAERLGGMGVPDALAWTVAVSDAALAALPAVALAAAHDVEPRTAARIQFLLDDQLGLERVRARIGALSRADRWQAEARAALRDDFYESQQALTAAVLREGDPSETAEARVAAWFAAHADAVSRYQSLAADVEHTEPGDLAALAVVRRALRDLVALD